ncbi:MAG: homoserine dehydrogenase [Bergeyella sp.]|nr:homoserine dehydrogenase [Bergeyella sp.]
MKNANINIYPQKALIKFEGKNFQGQIDIAPRIFGALKKGGISVGVISQQTIENGVSVLVEENKSDKAVLILEEEFLEEKNNGTVGAIYSIKNLAVVGFISGEFNKILSELHKNKIFPLFLNQVSSSGRINLIITENQSEITKSIVETEILDKARGVHLVLLGHGNVGGTLIDQIIKSHAEILRRKNIDLRIVAIANSKKTLLDKSGIKENWREKIKNSETETRIDHLILYAKENHLENLIVVDNTASESITKNYSLFVKNGFDVVSSNKIFNTLSISSYKSFRRLLRKNKKNYLYETNVGAGLPLIDTIKLLHLSGENITEIKGVFSGSLSYIFNRFSMRQAPFSVVVKEAMEKGFTESDPREDLSGNDVGRKLLILARELDLINEFTDIKIENLIPKELQNTDKESFISRLEELNAHFQEIKEKQKPHHVLRYVGHLYGDLQKEKGILKVKLLSVEESSAMGQLSESDSIFEIFTESYGDRPIVIIGAGAGAKVTARGVLGDILRISRAKTA